MRSAAGSGWSTSVVSRAIPSEFPRQSGGRSMTMTTRSVDDNRHTNILRREQELDNEDLDTGASSARTVDMSFLSNATSFVDASGVGHVKVNDSMDWSNILPNDTTVRIIYEGSGSNEEVLIIPVDESTSESASSSSSGSFGSDTGSMSGNTTVNPIDNLPTGSSSDSSSGDSGGVVGRGSTPTTLVIVGSILAVIAIAAIFAVVMYGRRNRRRARAISEDPSHNDEPFIVGDLPHQPAPQLSVLDTDITPDLWVEGQYQYSPNMSRLQNSLDGTAILSDNNTTSSHLRLTVDAYPFSQGNTQRGNTQPGNTQRGRRDHSALDDISDRGRHRMGTTPIVLYDQEAFEERNTNSSRKYHHPRQSSQQRQPSQQQRERQRHRRHRDTQEQQRTSRRDKYATRRDR